MALITDPDNLSQGASLVIADGAWTASSGAVTTITGAATLPALTAGKYFEIRDHSNPVNNGLYKESGGSPTTSSITATKINGSSPVNATAESITWLGNTSSVANQKSVMVDTANRDIYLLENGNLSSDGVTLQCLYSFLKEEWKDDTTLISYPFPATAITPEQFEFTSNWNPQDTTSPFVIRSRKLIRTGGWREIDTTNVLLREYAGIVTLGTFEDSASDLAHYQVGSDPTDTTAAISFDFAGPVNEAILTYRKISGPFSGVGIVFAASTITRPSGSWITDGFKIGAQVTIENAEDSANNTTQVINALSATVITVIGTPYTVNVDDEAATFSLNYRNKVKLFLRIRDGDTNGKTYAQSQLTDIGVTAVDNKVFRYPISNATDLKITETDANIVANSPYTAIKVRYFDQAFNREVDSATNRNFGIVIDVGTHSGVDGSAPGAGSVLTTAEGGMTINAFSGGTLRIHEGTNENTTFPIVSNTATTITVTGTIAVGSNLSFTAQLATPVVATAEKIYEKIQYLLRQAADVDSSDQTVTGKTADALLRFVGETLETGQAIPSNPNGGGSGVIIEGFSTSDTNRLTFYDNLGTARTYPFVAAGTISFNSNLVSDGAAKYWMFYQYTLRKTVTDFAISGFSGSNASIDSAGGNLPTVVQNDYINIQGCTTPGNNGIWRVTDAVPTTSQFDATRIDTSVVIANEAAASRTVDKNPIDTPQAILVKDNSDVDITGVIGGATATFDFDYDNNVQGGRTAATNAAIIIRAIGLNTAQFVETTGTITRATGQAYSLVSPLERNFVNI